MSKYLLLTVGAGSDKKQRLVNMGLVKIARNSIDGTNLTFNDDFFIVVNESLEQIEAQLLRDEFAKAALAPMDFEHNDYESTVAIAYGRRNVKGALEMIDLRLKDAEIHSEESERLTEKQEEAHNKFLCGSFPGEWIYEVANSEDDALVLELILSDDRFQSWHDRLEKYVVERLVNEN